MKIWDVELDDFEFGWNSILNEAKEKYPYGIFVKVENNNVDFSNQMRDKKDVLFNPIEYKKLLHKHYNMLCNEAKQLLSREPVDIARLLTIDILLWSIMWDYTKTPMGECEDYLMYDPRMFASEQSMWTQYEDYEEYFSFDSYELDSENEITKFAYIKMKNEKTSSKKYIPHSSNLTLE